MNVKCWGPTAWFTLHKITANYPIKPTKEDKMIHYKLFANLKETLPCKHCRKSYKQYFKEIDITNYLETRETIMYWLYIIHNKVNEKLREQGYKITKDPKFEDIYKFYTSKTSKCCCPCLLNVINCIAFNYNRANNRTGPTLQEKRSVNELLYILRFLLPCEDCKKIYNNYMDKNKVRLETKGSFVKWSFNLTNEMRRNFKCNKRQYITYNKYCEYYNSQNTGCNENSCRI